MTSDRNPGSLSLWRRVTLRDVLFFTVPPLALAIYLFGASVLDYHKIRQFDDWWSNATSVRKFGYQRVRALWNLPRALELERELDPEDETLPHLRLRVDRGEWNAIDRDVAAHWGEWIDVEVAEGNDLHRAELRFRGDGSVHWTGEKKSFTLKTSRGNLFKGWRTLAFSVKDVLSQYLANSLASDFGVLAPDTEVLPVYLNERFYGLFRFVETVDESFLRRHALLPGNVFRGDAAERGEYFKGLPRELFLNPTIWDRVAKNDRPGAIGTAGLFEWIADLNGTTFEEHERFMARMDRGELARMLALTLAVGDPFHMSGVHNQLWYEDPAAARLHPIAWDLRLLPLGRPPPHSEINRFWRAALRDPALFDLALGEIASRIEGERLFATARGRIEEVARKYRAAIEYDRLRSGAISPVGSAEEALSLLRANLDHLREWIRDARVAYHAAQSADGTWVLDLESRGRAAALWTGLEPLPEGALVRADTNGDGLLDVEDREVAFDAPVRLLSGCRADADRLEPEPIHQRFFLSGSGADAISAPRPILRNAHTGENLEPEAWEQGARVAASASWHPRRYAEPERTESRIEGEMVLMGDLVIPPHRTLVIAPGTTIRLAPDVSIVAKGRVLALGTADAPIEIESIDEGVPFGTIALQGAGASKSRFTHVRIRGGGGDLIERVEYTGMVCVHGASDVVFEQCTFERNLRCDDSLHADKAGVEVLRCLFQDGNSDSIDFDMSTGRIEGCTIRRTVNDGVDVMTCGPAIVGNSFSACGDKGISVGEASFPFVFGNVIEGCKRGMEIKDASQPLVVNTRIRGCEEGLVQRLKNWRYGLPGWAKLVNSVVEGNAVDYAGDPDARLTLCGSQLGPLASSAAAGDAPGPEAEAIAWLLLEHGIEPVAPEPGPPAEWRRVPDGERGAAEVLAALAFEEDFRAPTDGWRHDGGVTQLEKRRGDLIANFRRAPGRIGRGVDWDLSLASREYVLVLEIATEGLVALEVTAASEAGDVRFPVAPTDGRLRYRYATIALEPRRYRGLILSATPASPLGRLALHGVRVLALPKGSGAR